MSFTRYKLLQLPCHCRFIDDNQGFVLGNDGVLLRYLGWSNLQVNIFVPSWDIKSHFRNFFSQFNVVTLHSTWEPLNSWVQIPFQNNEKWTLNRRKRKVLKLCLSWFWVSIFLIINEKVIDIWIYAGLSCNFCTADIHMWSGSKSCEEGSECHSFDIVILL